MKLTSYLYIDTKGHMILKKTKLNPKPAELALELSINIPDEFFKRPIPKIDINIPANYLIEPNIESVACFAAFEIADKLQLDTKLVEDGLLALLKDKFEETKNNE